MAHDPNKKAVDDLNMQEGSQVGPKVAPLHDRIIVSREPPDRKLTIETENTRPVELADLTASFLSFGDSLGQFHF